MASKGCRLQFFFFKLLSITLMIGQRKFASSKLPTTEVEGSILAYTPILPMVHKIYTMTMTSLRVVVQQNCSDIMCISGY